MKTRLGKLIVSKLINKNAHSLWYYDLLGPQQASEIKANLSKQSGVLVGRRRSSIGRRILLCTPTTLVRSKGSNSHSKALARYDYTQTSNTSFVFSFLTVCSKIYCLLHHLLPPKMASNLLKIQLVKEKNHVNLFNETLILLFIKK